MEVVSRLPVVLGLCWHGMGLAIVPSVDVGVGMVRGRGPRVDVCNSLEVRVGVLPFSVVDTPEDMVVNICFIVVSIQVLEFVSVVIDEHIDVVYSVVWLVVSEVVSTEHVVVLHAGVVVLVVSVVQAVMLPCVVVVMMTEAPPVVRVGVAVVVLVMLIVEVSLVAVVVVLACGKAVQKVPDVALVMVMFWVVTSCSRVLPLYLHSAFLLLTACLILMWGHTELLFMVLVVIVPLLEAVDAGLSVPLVDVGVVSMVDHV